MSLSKNTLSKGKSALSLVLIGFFLILTGCVRNPATRKVHARLLSQEAEKKIGEETKIQILKQYSELDNADVQAYVNRVGQKIARLSDRPTVDFEFTVLNHDLINAFAAPGGFIFVTRGLLESISDEAELAMVLGHEIAHVTALHGVQMIQKEMGQNALTVLGTIGAAIVAGPEAMLLVGQTGSLFSGLYLLGYSREKELEADNLGLQYMLRAGYDPQASLRFLEELGKGDSKDLKGWDLYFRTHPATKERIEIIEHMIGRDIIKNPVTNKKDFERMKALLPKIDPKERGVIKKNSYTNSVHDLKLTVPENWRLGFYHSQSLISFQTKDQKGEGRLQVVRLSSTTKTAEALAKKFSKDAGFQFINGKNILYKAGYGFLGRFIGYSPRGKPLEYRMFITIRRNLAYVLMCGAPPTKLESYILDLESIMRSLEFG